MRYFDFPRPTWSAIRSRVFTFQLSKLRFACLAFLSVLASSFLQAESVFLSWTDRSSVEDGFFIERSEDGISFSLIGEAPRDADSYNDDTVELGEKYYYRICSYNDFGCSDYSAVGSITVTGNAGGPDSLTIPNSEIVGTMAAEGGASYDRDANLHLIAASGDGLELLRDKLRFTYVPVAGDFEITAQVHYFDADDALARVGLMLRGGLDSEERHVSIAIGGKGKYEALLRSSRGANANLVSAGEAGSEMYLKMTRKGAYVRLYYSHDGIVWSSAGYASMRFEGEALLGIALGSHRDGRMSGALVEILESDVEGFYGSLDYPEYFSAESGSIESLLETLAAFEDVELGSNEGVAVNAVQNGSFEQGFAPWKFYTNGSGDAKLQESGSGSALLVDLKKIGSNVQLFQNDISLVANTEYQLSFSAYSNSGRDFSVTLSKHSSPYTVYGLFKERVDLGSDWQRYTINFTTAGFNEMVNDGRLYFWFADHARYGDRYFIDDVELVRLDGSYQDSQDSDPDPDPSLPVEPEPAPEPDPEPEPEPEPEEGDDSNDGIGSLPEPELGVGIIKNGGFESQFADWNFFTNAKGGSAIVSPGYQDSGSAFEAQIDRVGNNIQLFQNGLSLKPNTSYRLTFAAYSNVGRDMSVSLCRHDSPYTNYGLNSQMIDLDTSWKYYTLVFTTENFEGPVSNGRLYFWFADRIYGGERYYIDQVSLTALPDLEAPTQPGSFEAKRLTGKKVRLDWDASVDGGGSVGYLVYRDGAILDSSVGNSYVDEDAAGPHSYRVSAFDADGNESEPTAESAVGK